VDDDVAAQPDRGHQVVRIVGDDDVVMGVEQAAQRDAVGTVAGGISVVRVRQRSPRTDIQPVHRHRYDDHIRVDLAL